MLFLSKTKKEQTFITNCGEHKDYPTTFDHSNANPKEGRKERQERSEVKYIHTFLPFYMAVNCTVGIKISEIFSRRISQPKMIFSALASKRLFYLLF